MGLQPCDAKHPKIFNLRVFPLSHLPSIVYIRCMNTEELLIKAQGRIKAQAQSIELLQSRLKDRDVLIRKQVETIKTLAGPEPKLYPWGQS